MELNESLIITFLLIVIVILIFSNITVSLGNSDNNTQNQTRNVKTPDVTKRPTLYKYKVNNDLLSDDVKKQLNTLNNQFYFNDCRI